MRIFSLAQERRGAVVAGLRARIAKLERLAPENAEVLPLGVPALDGALGDGGLAAGLHELNAAPGAAGALLGFAAALAGLSARRGPVLWIGSAPLYGPGFAAYGLKPEQVLLVRASAKAVPWAMEEGLKSRALGAVVGETAAIDLTAARRLQLAAAASGGLALLLRAEGGEADGVGLAATRWRIDAAPSAPMPSLSAQPALGRPRWAVSLLHGRHGARPGDWIVEWEHDGRFALAGGVAAALADRPLAARAAG